MKVSEVESSKGEAALKNDEMCYLLKQIGIEICGVQETRMKHKPDRTEMVNSYPSAFGYTLYTASAWENESKAATGGIGLFLGRQLMNSSWALNVFQTES